MGAGIAQLGALAGVETHIHDPVAEALAAGIEKTRANLAKGAERGRWSEEDADAAAGRLHPAAALEDLAGCDFVIEAAPERLELKRELFQELSGICGADAVLATNTSSIPVTFLATAAAEPANVVGMHFFNPAPLMKLVEVIRGLDTSDAAIEAARELGEAMGKRVILAADGPGFLVNRCGRPFYSEALRLLQERVATHEQIDRICRLGGGLPHGAVRADGHGGDRRRLRGRQVVQRAQLRRAALEAEPDPGADGARRPPRPQERPRLLRLHGRGRAPPARPGPARAGRR